MISSETVEIKQKKSDEPVHKNGLEEDIDNYIANSISSLKFSLIYKPAIISFLALLFSFFLDLSYVPLLGDISKIIGKALFPTWQPAAGDIVPYSFWWLPVVVYGLFILLAYLSYSKLKTEVKRSAATETIDRIIASYTSVIDSISTALPLLGAALLLISIKLGEEIFLGLSVPFEVKALIVLAIGKLFEPVLDQLGIEFQNIVNHVKDKRERYFSRIQIENYKNLLRQINPQARFNENSLKELDTYRNMLSETTKYSEALLKNFSAIYAILDKVKNVEMISAEKIGELNRLAENIAAASQHLGDERTLKGLVHLENIVVKK